VAMNVPTLKQKQVWAIPEPKNMIEQDLNEMRILIKKRYWLLFKE